MKKILIANRGEIALRIIRACRDAGYLSVAIASEADSASLHAREADECHVLKGNSPRETYLNQEAVLAIAKKSCADAVHPGYGLLSENEIFAAAIEAAGLIWIGPAPHVIAQLGDKVAARAVARSAGAPLLPSFEDGELTPEKARAFIEQFGLPAIIKAQNGGGGRGMRIVREVSEVDAQLAAAVREAELAFGRPECFIERYVEHARHVETQCLADSFGNVLVVSTRDCTLQRRQQKLVEEAPAPFITDEQHAQLVDASVRILSTVGYRGAATCEFLVTPEGAIYFLEVNTRIQVEHPVTEEISGRDLIREMFNIAQGGRLDMAPRELRGHSIEFRINAEDPWQGFQPTPGVIKRLELPMGPGVRLDFGYRTGDTVPPYYDSLIGKIIVTGSDRSQALARARRAFRELQVVGIETIAPFHQAVLESPEFTADSAQSFSVHTRWIDAELPRLADLAQQHRRCPVPEFADEIEVQLSYATPDDEKEAPSYRQGVPAPLSGVILELLVKEGDPVAVGEIVAVMEAMKMEQPVIAEHAGKIAKINAAVGQFIEMHADILGLD